MQALKGEATVAQPRSRFEIHHEDRTSLREADGDRRTTELHPALAPVLSGDVSLLVPDRGLMAIVAHTHCDSRAIARCRSKGTD